METTKNDPTIEQLRADKDTIENFSDYWRRRAIQSEERAHRIANDALALRLNYTQIITIARAVLNAEHGNPPKDPKTAVEEIFRLALEGLEACEGVARSSAKKGPGDAS